MLAPLLSGRLWQRLRLDRNSIGDGNTLRRRLQGNRTSNGNQECTGGRETSDRARGPEIDSKEAKRIESGGSGNESKGGRGGRQTPRADIPCPPAFGEIIGGAACSPQGQQPNQKSEERQAEIGESPRADDSDNRAVPPD